MENTQVTGKTKLRTFRCTGCRTYLDLHPDDVEKWELEFTENGVVPCDETEGCDGFYREVSETETTMMWLNLYRTEQCYGGPEEGGWYYRQGEALGSIPLLATYWYEVSSHTDIDELKLRASPDARAQERAEQLLELVVDTDDGDCLVRLEDHVARDFPQTRPHYE